MPSKNPFRPTVDPLFDPGVSFERIERMKQAQIRANAERALKRDTRWVEPPEIWEGWREGDPSDLEPGRGMTKTKLAKNYVRRWEKWVLPAGTPKLSPDQLLGRLEPLWRGKGREAWGMKKALVEQVLDRPGAEGLTLAQMRKVAPDLTGAWLFGIRKNAEQGVGAGPSPVEGGRTKTDRVLDQMEKARARVQGSVPDVVGQELLPGIADRRVMQPEAGRKTMGLAERAWAVVAERPAAANALNKAAFYQSQGYEAGSELRKAKKLLRGEEAAGSAGAQMGAARGEPAWQMDQRRAEGKAKDVARVEAEMQATKSTRDRERLEKKWWRLTQGGRPQDPEGQRKWDMEQGEWEAATRQNREMERLEGRRRVVDLKKRFEKVSGQLPDVPGQTFLQNPRDKGALLWAGRVTKGQFGLSIPREKKGVGWEGMRNLMRIREAAEASEPGAIAFMREAGIPLDLRGVTPEGLRAGQVFKGGMQKGMRQLLKLLAVLPK